MAGSKVVVRGLWVALLLELAACGGRATSDPSAPAADVAGAVGGGGAGVTIDTCGGAAGEPDGGCGGEAGERPLEPYAGLRTACSLAVRVSRRGAPVSVDCHIR